MSAWTCTLCGATGTENTPKGAHRAHDHHYLQAHYEPVKR